MRTSPGHGSDDRAESGQIIVLFALSMVVMLAVAGLLFSGAYSLVVRRALQNAGDAASLAGANILQSNPAGRGCSASGSGGPPRASVVAAVKASVATNMPSLDLADVIVTCPEGWQNQAVSVSMRAAVPSYFGSATLTAGASSSAVNGQVSRTKYSVVMLNNSNTAWGSGYDGCPSLLIGGGIQATFEGSVMVNSTCKVLGSTKGAMDANGGSARIVLANSAEFRLAGEYNKQNLAISGSAPVENVRPLLADPLAGLTDPLSYVAAGKASLATYTQTNVCKGANKNPCTLDPGIYTGGINTSGGQVLFMRPGVYVMNGGGFNLGPSSVFSIPANKTSTSTSTWNTDCPLGSTTCGVMIYNATTSTWASNKDLIGMGANTILRLRAYSHAADAANGAAFAEYDNVLFWQARTPQPAAGTPQPPVTLGGGGDVVLSGTVYAPGAQVKFGGGGSGSGGANENLTIQFICWDLQLQGNSNFTFQYRSDLFARPTTYGLVQ